MREFTNRAQELDWGDISDPGCYLMLSSGLLARVHPEDLPPDRRHPRRGGGPRVAKLSSNPREPIVVLRQVATRSRYLVRF